MKMAGGVGGKVSQNWQVTRAGSTSTAARQVGWRSQTRVTARRLEHTHFHFASRFFAMLLETIVIRHQTVPYAPSAQVQLPIVSCAGSAARYQIQFRLFCPTVLRLRCSFLSWSSMKEHLTLLSGWPDLCVKQIALRYCTRPARSAESTSSSLRSDLAEECR